MTTPPRYYSSTALPTNLTTSITNADTTLQVGSTDGFPASTPFTLAVDYGAINEELVDVTAVAGLSLTVTRAVDFTSASSHNAGAICRHVSSARDFREAKAHEAAVTNVHGFTPADGEFVGTTKTQTLTNKTLTAPTINGGTLAGTFSGAHTYSGAITFSSNISVGGSATIGTTLSVAGATTLSGGGTMSGTFAGNPTFSGANTHTASIDSIRPVATNSSFTTRITGDAGVRFNIRADGQLEWGPGDGSLDVILRRAAANLLTTDDTLLINRPTINDHIILGGLPGDSNARIAITADGYHAWGPGGAGAADTVLYRQVAGVLATDNIFRIFRPLPGDSSLSLRMTGDTADRLRINADGSLNWGPGGGVGPDTNLYRPSTNILRTDDSLEVGGSITAGGKLIGDNIRAGNALTPSAGASGGTSTVNVVFSSPMPATPAVVITPNTTIDPNPSGVIIEAYVDNITASGFTIRAYRNSNSATNFSWIAVVE